MPRVGRIAICFGICWILTCSWSESAERLLHYQVGAAKVDITPQTPILLSGYASRGLVEIEQVQQKLWARAIAISSKDTSPALLITVDNCGVPLSIRKNVTAALEHDGIPAKCIAISSSHTHAGPMLTGVLENLVVAPIPDGPRDHIDRYTDFLTKQLIAVARLAWKQREPAELSFATGRTGFANNRRTGSGPNDHDVPVLRARDANGRIRAIVLGYACHCTALPGVSYISGDWAGYASDYLEETYEDAIALTVIGCGADQNPAPRGTLDVTKQHGRTLAEEVKRLVNGEMRTLTQPISCTYDEIELAFAAHPPRSHWENLAEVSGINGFHARQMLALLDNGQGLPSEIDYPIQTWTFGDELGMVFLADEVVVDYSLRLKREMGGERLWVAAYSNDERCYIPSERVLKEGGYEAGGAMVWYGWPGPFAAGLEDKIVAEVRRQLPQSYDTAVEAPQAFREALEKIDPSRTGNTRPLAPQEAAAAIQTHRNLRVELVASEPLIIDPVAIDWAADGSLWVAEMHDYPEGIDGNYAPGGRVKLLRDTNGDGEFDRGTIFLDGIPFPTGVTSWDRGVLVCAAPDVIYAEDTDGDGIADIRKSLLTGFVTHNYQARVNSLSYGLDNWLYAAAGIFGGVIQTSSGQQVDISNRDFRFLPDPGIVEPVSGRTQQGRARDDFGNWFGCSNGDLLSHYPSTEHYIQRNPLTTPPPSEIRLGDGTLFPPKGLVTFELTGPVGRPTAACGLGIYRDTLLGEEYYGNTFTCEPVNQLVHRKVLKPNGVTFTAERASTEQESEFIVSTDNWFRPVQARTGPDGALYIVDMCRYVIEHPRWIPPAARNALDLRAGDRLGRIYRVLPQDEKRREVPDLTKLETASLVAALDTPNGTLRDLVQFRLIRSGDREAVEPLESLARQSRHAATRVQALHTLDGLNALSDDLILQSLKDNVDSVRRHVIELSEKRLKDAPPLQSAVLEMVDDDSPQVQLQLAYSLGELTTPQAADVLADLALAHHEDPYIRAAVLSSATGDHLPLMLARVLDHGQTGDAMPAIADDLLKLATRQESKTPLDRLVSQIAPENQQAWSVWQLHALSEIIRASQRQKVAFESQTQQLIAAAAQSARSELLDSDALLDRRVAAVQLLAADFSHKDLDLLEDLLAPNQPTALQVAAITAFGQSLYPAVPPKLLSAWSSLGPASRQAVLSTVMSNQTGAISLLGAVEAGTVQASELNATQRQQLLASQDERVRKLAARMLPEATNSNREAIIQAYRDGMPEGNAERGKLAFAKICAACHRLDGIGHSVGPDLAALTNRSREALLTAVLDPNRDVDQRYTGYTVITTEGLSFHGILAAESNNAVTLKAQANKTQTILRADIEVLHATGKSMMPEGIERDVSPATLADLLAYLGAGGGIPYRYAGNDSADPSYPDEPRHPKLTDGILGSEHFNDGQWVGVRAGGGVRPSLVFDFGLPRIVKNVNIVYGVNHIPGGIHAPDQVTVSYSDNGKEFSSEQTFEPFDDSTDGLGTYQIARRTVSLAVEGRTSRFLRLDFVNDGEWTFLCEIAFDTPVGQASVSEQENNPDEESTFATSRRIAELVAQVKVGTPDEYRNIPDIWRQAIAAGRRNVDAELLAVLNQSLPQSEEPLRDWQAVVIGGGIINGLTLAGVWPNERINEVIGTNEGLRLRWKSSLAAAAQMADDEQVKHGTRYDALRMVAMLPWSECGKQLERYLGKDVNGELQQGAVSGLGDIVSDDATMALIRAFPHLTPGNQKFAAQALVRTPEKITALLTSVGSGDISALHIPADVKDQLRTHQDATVRKASMRLFP